jgi:hypothetical protein
MALIPLLLGMLCEQTEWLSLIDKLGTRVAWAHRPCNIKSNKSGFVINRFNKIIGMMMHATVMLLSSLSLLRRRSWRLLRSSASIDRSGRTCTHPARISMLASRPVQKLGSADRPVEEEL